MSNVPNTPPDSQTTVSDLVPSRASLRHAPKESPASPPEPRTLQLWKFRIRRDEDDEPEDWWMASTAIPLLAATLGPLANVLSIAALVTSWRENYTDSGADADAIGFRDPHWYGIFDSNTPTSCLLLKTNTLYHSPTNDNYIVFQGILIGITAAMNNHIPPIRPHQTYSQGFWHAVIAAVLYLFCSMILMINMLGYFLGHYHQHFALTDDQRNLILQTMMFFIWLAGGGGVFSRVSGFTFVDALYFCDVTILTVGFGDITANNDAGRGLVFPYSVGGIIILGLVISSISRFSREIGHDKIIKKHLNRRRVMTVGRSVTTSLEFRQRTVIQDTPRPEVSKVSPADRTIAYADDEHEHSVRANQINGCSERPVRHSGSEKSRGGVIKRVRSRARKPKIYLLREEKDRFDCMRRIQAGTAKYRRWYALTLSIIAFGLLWCVGAVVFWQVEHREQDLSYFESLYFCYVSLLTIGYGDKSPKSNAGKPFFIVWSLIAVPTMTILIGDMGDTVIASFKRGTFRLADWTVLPKQGIWRTYLENHPWLLHWVQRKEEARAAKKRLEMGFQAPDIDAIDKEDAPTIEDLATESNEIATEHDLARKLALAIRRTANDLKLSPPKKYSYEEWVVFTRLIRFSSARDRGEVDEEEEEEGLI
ncbi:MAG: Potassium channel, partial [Candelina submexicana]